MFTGIIAEVGEIRALAEHPGGARIEVAASFAADLAIGESVAVSGCCLTVVARSADGFTADLSLETLRLTAFRAWGVGSPVNLERALRLSDRLGGHLVQGHVDGVGRLHALRPEGDGYRLAVALPEELRPYVARKGSLAVNGISLTVAALEGALAEFAVIAHTHRATDLRARRADDPVHLEVDVIARYLEALTRAKEA